MKRLIKVEKIENVGKEKPQAIIDCLQKERLVN